MLKERSDQYSLKIWEIQENAENMEDYLLWKGYEEVLMTKGIRFLPLSMQKIINA